MTSKTKFIKSVTDAAKTLETPLPWQRGTRRATFIARRRSVVPKRKTA